VLIPAAYGLAGQNLHTYAGWGSVPYWNAYVANTQMQGQGTFYDPRLADPDKFPLVAQTGWDDKRDEVDKITPKLEALHYYQLSIPPPTPPEGSFSAEAADRGAGLFRGKAQCATCHVPPLFSEPGWAMHTGAEIGIDEFQALRSPDERYRTTPLRGLWARMQGGFYHDGRFADLGEVIDHYEPVLGFTLNSHERADLIEYLRSI
jgi:cytochrome c peroxidase